MKYLFSKSKRQIIALTVLSTEIFITMSMITIGYNMQYWSDVLWALNGLAGVYIIGDSWRKSDSK